MEINFLIIEKKNEKSEEQSKHLIFPYSMMSLGRKKQKNLQSS